MPVYVKKLGPEMFLAQGELWTAERNKALDFDSFDKALAYCLVCPHKHLVITICFAVGMPEWTLSPEPFRNTP